MGTEAEVKGENPIRKEEREEEEKWVKYYSSFHEILLVGEGDFSFALCLATSFGSASTIVATSLDSHAALIRKYKEAKTNVECLENLGATVLHGVDATKMKFHIDLRMRKYDRIVYNFPHAGFYGKEDNICLLRKHRSLVCKFFRNARSMLRPDGEVHVNHKTTPPFSYWNLQELASWNSLTLIECVDFRLEDFPGYHNKRGDGLRCDEPFPLGECSTFKFIVSPAAMKMSKESNPYPAFGCSRTLQIIPVAFQRQPVSIVRLPPPHMLQTSQVFPVPFQRQPVSIVRPPPPHSLEFFSSRHEYNETPNHINVRSECLRLFGGYLNHVEETFGEPDFDVPYPLHEAMRLGYDMKDTWQKIQQERRVVTRRF